MILGIGIDLCSITRIEKVRRMFPEKFERKILSNREIKELENRIHRDAYLAKRFAAKEAIYKAFSFMDQNNLTWQEVEILNQGKSGAPTVSLRGTCLKKFKEKLGCDFEGNIHLSLTDEYPYVMAYVIIEKVVKSKSELLKNQEKS